MIDVAVMYENKDGARFDEDYYINKHLKLVHDLWDDMGLTKVQVERGVGGGAPGEPATYKIIAHLVFDSMESLQKAMEKAGALQEDLANFTDIPPTIQMSEVIHSETV